MLDVYCIVLCSDTKTIPETFSYLIDYYDGVGTGRYYNINFDNILRSFGTLKGYTNSLAYLLFRDLVYFNCSEQLVCHHGKISGLLRRRSFSNVFS